MKEIKSVDEILKEIDELEAQHDEIAIKVDELEEELLRVKKVEALRKMCEDLYDLYYCLEEAGFTQDQSWELFTMIFSNNLNSK